MNDVLSYKGISYQLKQLFSSILELNNAILGI